MAIANNASSASRSSTLMSNFTSFKDSCHVQVGTKDHHADTLTKELWPKKFMVHRAALTNQINLV